MSWEIVGYHALFWGHVARLMRRTLPLGWRYQVEERLAENQREAELLSSGEGAMIKKWSRLRNCAAYQLRGCRGYQPRDRCSATSRRDRTWEQRSQGSSGGSMVSL